MAVSQRATIIECNVGLLVGTILTLLICLKFPYSTLGQRGPGRRALLVRDGQVRDNAMRSRVRRPEYRERQRSADPS